jgi:hypothetical protein
MKLLLAGIGPFGVTEIIIIAGLIGFMALAVGGVIFLVVHLTKKQK